MLITQRRNGCPQDTTEYETPKDIRDASYSKKQFGRDKTGSASQGVLNLRSPDHMSDEKVPAELLAVRDKIDETDERLLDLLAERVELTHRVGLLKANQNLTSFDGTREAEKLSRLAELSKQRNLNPELVTALFRQIMQQVVRNHESLKSAD